MPFSGTPTTGVLGLAPTCESVDDRHEKSGKEVQLDLYLPPGLECLGRRAKGRLATTTDSESEAERGTRWITTTEENDARCKSA
jgi:hypothetical protein